MLFFVYWFLIFLRAPLHPMLLVTDMQIARNITTNELANSARYSYLRGPEGRFRNPYNRGCHRNCTDFWVNGYTNDEEIAWPSLNQVVRWNYMPCFHQLFITVELLSSYYWRSGAWRVIHVSNIGDLVDNPERFLSWTNLCQSIKLRVILFTSDFTALF